MPKDNTGAPYKRPQRYFMGVLIISVMFCAMMPYISPSIFMGDIMESFGVDLGLAGLSMSVQLVMAGVCFFIGSFFEEKLGHLKTIKLALAALLAGAVISVAAPNIYIFLLARLIAGFGQGLAVCLTAFMSTWYTGKELSLMMAFNSMGSAIGVALSVALCRPLANALGSWKGAIGVFATLTGVFTVLWFVFGKNSPEGLEQEKTIAAQRLAGGKQQSSLVMALKEPQFWKLLVYAAIFTIASTALATYIPTYMMSVRGVPEGLATSAVSIQSMFGLVGSLLGGVVVTRIWRRKAPMFFGLCAYILCGLAITFAAGNGLIAVLVAVMGFFYYLPIVAQSTIVIETSLAKNPGMISGGMALTAGTGMLLTLIVPPIFQALVDNADMTVAYRVFFIAGLIGVAALCLLKETGKKPQSKPEAKV